MKDQRKKRLRIILLLLILTTLTTVSAEDQYGIKTSIQSPEPIKYEEFGGAVAASQDFIIIGATKGTSGGVARSGIVYVFNSDGDLVKTIESPNPEPNAKFGHSITTDGELIIIASDETVESKIEAGKVYVFDIEGNLIQELQSPNPDHRGHFGGFIAFDEEYLVISEEFIGLDEIYWPPNSQDTAEDAESHGKVYIYDWDYNIQHTLEAKYQARCTCFGVGTDLSGDYIVVSEVKLNQIHIYDVEGNLLTTIESPNPYDAFFGISTAISGNKVAVGDSRNNLVFIYDLNGNLLETLTPPEGYEGKFGHFVDFEEDLIAVSDPEAEINGLTGAGYVFLYDVNGNLISTVTSPNPEKNAYFGGLRVPRSCISISGGRIIVGESGYDTDELSDAGLVHVIEKGSFTVTLSGLTIEPSEIDKGDSTMCSIICTNEGTFSGQYNVVLMVDGEVREEKTISLDSGGSETVSFELSGDTVAIHQVDINGQTGSFEVKDVIPGFPIIALTFGIIASFLVYKKRY